MVLAIWFSPSSDPNNWRVHLGNKIGGVINMRTQDKKERIVFGLYRNMSLWAVENKNVGQWPRPTTWSLYGDGHRIENLVLKDNDGWGDGGGGVSYELASGIHLSLHATVSEDVRFQYRHWLPHLFLWLKRGRRAWQYSCHGDGTLKPGWGGGGRFIVYTNMSMTDVCTFPSPNDTSTSALDKLPPLLYCTNNQFCGEFFYWLRNKCRFAGIVAAQYLHWT